MTNLERLLNKEKAYYCGDEILLTVDFTKSCETEDSILVVFRYKNDNGFLDVETDWLNKFKIESKNIKFFSF